MRIAALLLALPFALSAQAPPLPPTAEQLFAAHRLDEARAAFQARLAKDKNDANALYFMGRIADEENRSGEAVDWFEKAVKRNDKSALYHFWLGNALGDEAQKANKLRQPFLARRVKNEFERAVTLDPKMPEPRQGLVDFYSIAPGIMGGSMDKAKEQAVELIKLNPLQGHLAVARVARRQKDAAAEERAYEAALAAAPDSTQPYYGLAAFYRRQSRWDDAFATYDRLLHMKPDDATAHVVWGITAAQSGKNLDRGERELKYYLEKPPTEARPQDFSAVHFRLGQLYEKTSRRDLAKAEYAEAVKLNPQNRDAKKALDALR